MVSTHNKPTHHFWRGRILPRLALLAAPLPRNTFCSIDVTSKCNLRCRHCYFYSYDQGRKPELTTEEWLARIEAWQQGKGAFFSCTWVGGEPLLKPELIERGRHFFRSNRVVTNGTIPLPDWPDVEFHISADGTEKLHDSIRGQGCYAKIKSNILNPGSTHLNIVLACCLNRANAGCAEDLVREWRDVPNVHHMLFDFLTPTKGIEEDLWLTFEERDRIIRQLEELKRRYGDFIGAPPGTFNLMRSQNRHRAVGTSCVFRKSGVAFDAWGQVKRPCVIGPHADCDRCGCIVPFSIRAWKQPSNLLREIWRELSTAVNHR